MWHTPNFEETLKALWRNGRPSHLPFYEHLASAGFIANRTTQDFLKLNPGDPGYWEIYVDFWLGMGYDFIPMEVPFNCPLPEGHGAESEGSEAKAVITSMEDFEGYPWPDESSPMDFSHFETVGSLLPEGAKIIGGVCMGPYEWVSQMMGTVGLSYAIMDEPELVDLMFDKMQRLGVSAVGQLAQMDCIGAIRQGDDLGFKTSTFLSPNQLRNWVFPTYKQMADLSHQQDKPFILHSCGNLGEVYEDIIACGVDAKHSFEDVILPVADFKRQYGDRITALGGLDVDVICRATQEELKAYTRKHVEECFADGFWALGTGNSLTNYMPVENYILILEEGRKVATGA